jgi:hypothetical protein
MAAGNGSEVSTGSRVVAREADSWASSESGGATTISRAPRRSASRAPEASQPFAAQHDDQVERADPAGQVPDRPGHEGHRAGRFEDGAQQPGLGADGDDRAGAALPGEAVDRLV